MDRRGIVVSYYFPPQGGGGVQRWVKFIKYLSQWNWQFSVICAPPEHSLPMDDSLLAELPPKLKIHRIPEATQIPGLWRSLSQKINRTYLMRWFGALFYVTDSRSYWTQMIKTRIDRLLTKQKFDVLIFTIPPYSLASLAAYYTESAKIPVILDLRDPWTINPYKIYPTPLHRYLDVQREKRAIRKIQFITSAYQTTLDYYQKTISGFNHKKVLHIPNGYDEADFMDLEENKSENDAIFKIGFSGSIYSHLNSPGVLLTALQILKNTGYQVELHHFGASVYRIDRFVRKSGLRDIYREHGYLPHKEVLRELMSMDATCLILDERYKNADKTVGGKLYEYLRLKKPIIAIVPEKGEAARTIYETNSGIVCSKRDPHYIAQQIINLLQHKIKFSFIGTDNFNRKTLSENLRDFLEQNISRSEE